MSRTRTTLAFAACLVAAPLAAQDWKGMGRLEGKVTDQSGAPLAGVTVRLELPERGGGTTVRTDGKGRWALGGIAAGTWNIDFEHEGYEPKKIEIALPNEASRLRPLEVQLEKASAAANGATPEVRDTLARADAAYAEGRFPEARTEYEKLLALRPDLAGRIHQQIGFCYLREKEPEQALAHLEQAIALEPGNAQLRLIAAQGALEGGMIEEGRALLAQVDDSAVSDPDIFYNIGINFLNAGRTEDAIRYFTKAVAVDPTYVDGYYRRGLAYLQLGQTEACRADLRKVLELTPQGEQAETARKALQQIG